MAENISDDDLPYIRNKVAQLWVDVTKICWGLDWMDMDSQLLDIWDKSKEDCRVANKLFVLSVLEVLSEERGE